MKDVVIYADNKAYETGDGLLEEFKIGFIKMWMNFTNEIHFICSIIFTAFLTAIGFDNHYEIISFLVNMAILDLITKHISIVIVVCGKFTIKNYFNCWREKYLTSRQFRIGVFVKLLTYSAAFYIANKLSIIPEFKEMFGITISNLIYSSIFIAELASLGENFRDMGINLFSKIIDGIKEQIKGKE